MFESKRKSFSVNSDPVSTAVSGRPPYHWNWEVERSFQGRVLAYKDRVIIKIALAVVSSALVMNLCAVEKQFAIEKAGFLGDSNRWALAMFSKATLTVGEHDGKFKLPCRFSLSKVLRLFGSSHMGKTIVVMEK